MLTRSDRQGSDDLHNRAVGVVASSLAVLLFDRRRASFQLRLRCFSIYDDKQHHRHQNDRDSRQSNVRELNATHTFYRANVVSRADRLIAKLNLSSVVPWLGSYWAISGSLRGTVRFRLAWSVKKCGDRYWPPAPQSMSLARKRRETAASTQATQHRRESIISGRP
jgi:hypothetical protein